MNKKYGFQQWLEYADFGLMPAYKVKQLVPGDKPLHTLNIENVVDDLVNQHLGVKEGVQLFYGDVRWGEGIGSVRLTFHPFGGTYAAIRKLAYDLNGEPHWVNKRIIEVGNHYDDKEDSLIFTVHKLLKEVDETGIDAPSGDYEGLEKLTLQLASVIRRHCTQRIFIYDGIKKLEENKAYIIKLNCAGMGVQRQDQKRLDQFQIEVHYLKGPGVIRIVGNEVGDRIRSHRWCIDPSQFSDTYMPSQSNEEIIGTVLGMLNAY